MTDHPLLWELYAVTDPDALVERLAVAVPA